MRFHIASPNQYLDRIDLPWDKPLLDWPRDLVVEVPRGISRNVVRFISHHGFVYALKELPEPVARKEYDLLKDLNDLALPVVEPVGLVTERIHDGQPLKSILITRFLEYALPFRTLIAGGGFDMDQERLLDALVDLLVRLHLSGFYWGDCSLSNTLFRRDAGRLAAWLVDAETGELHETLTDGQRSYDLDLAEQNIAGELMDLAAGYGLPAGIDPIETANQLVSRYQALWTELTRNEVFSVNEQYRIAARISRLNDMGFDVEELEIQTCETGHRLHMRPKVVEPGHHARRLQTLTGLVVQENQARRVLNDIFRYKAWLEGGQSQRQLPESVVAYRWFGETYLPTLEAIPPEHREKLDDAEIFHQILEHRWFMSEAAGRDVGLQEARQSYIRKVLIPMPRQSSVETVISSQVMADDLSCPSTDNYDAAEDEEPQLAEPDLRGPLDGSH